MAIGHESEDTGKTCGKRRDAEDCTGGNLDVWRKIELEENEADEREELRGRSMRGGGTIEACQVCHQSEALDKLSRTQRD